jgi:cytochrome c5
MRLFVAIVIASFIAGCAAAPTGGSKRGGIDKQPTGMVLYKRKCKSCHMPVKPKTHDDDNWARIMGEHRERFRMTDDEADRIINYLVENN